MPPAGPQPVAVLGIYREPPPADAPHIHYVRLRDERAARAGAWVTVRLHEAAEVIKKMTLPVP